MVKFTRNKMGQATYVNLCLLLYLIWEVIGVHFFFLSHHSHNRSLLSVLDGGIASRFLSRLWLRNNIHTERRREKYEKRVVETLVFHCVYDIWQPAFCPVGYIPAKRLSTHPGRFSPFLTVSFSCWEDS